MVLIKHYFDEYQQLLIRYNCSNSRYTFPYIQAVKQELSRQRAAEIMHVACFYKFQFMNWNEEEMEKNEERNDDLSLIDGITFNREFLEAAKKEMDRLLSRDLEK